MASYYNRLKADLDRAAADGIITPEQAAKVWDRSRAESLLGGIKAVHWIAAAAGSFIAIGVSLIVAHNWASIGAETKIAAFLLLLAAAAEGSKAAAAQKPTISTTLEILWFFLPAVGIGLYAQIFNLSGDPVRPYLLWAALSAPLAFLSARGLISGLLTILLFATLYFGTLNSANMMTLTGQVAQPWAHWALALGVLAAAGAVSLLRAPERGHGLPLGAGLVWLFLMLAADTALKLNTPALLLLAGMSAAVVWLLWAPGGEEPESKLPVTVWTGAVYAMTFFWHYRPEDAGFRADSPAGTLVTWALLACALGSLYLRPQRLLPAGKNEDAAARAMLAASMLCAFLLFGATQFTARTLAVLANLILAALGAGLILSGSRAQSEKLINRGVLVLTLTAVTRFVDIFGGMLRSGMAFIVTGVVFAALAYFVNRGRKALISAVKK